MSLATQQQREQIIHTMTDQGWLRTAQLAARLPWSVKTVGQRLRELNASGNVERRRPLLPGSGGGRMNVEAFELALAEDRLAWRCTDAQGRPCNGGSAEPLKLKKWSERVENAKLCRSGWHTTTDPLRWSGVRVWLVEGRGLAGRSGDKACWAQIRPLAEVDPLNCIDMRVMVAASRSDLEGANLEGADLRGAALRRANLQGAALRRANLEGAALRNADLRRADLQGAVLRDANLEGADLRDANLEGANLEGANLRNAVLRWADLEGAALRRADLQGAALRRANLEGANLRNAVLRWADLEGADLEGADLRNAVLRNAVLRWADLRGAVLEGADLRGAVLEGADLEGADLEGADLQRALGLPAGGAA